MTEIIDGVDVSGCEYLDKSPVDFWCGEVDGEYSAAYCNERPDCYYKQLKKIETENAKLKEELNRYKQMEAKGLEEFKDVGGCWGCGLQLQLEQDIKDLKKYGQENVELLQENAKLKKLLETRCYNEVEFENKKLKEALKKTKEIAETYRENCKIEGNCLDKRLCSTCYFGGGLEVCDDILDIIEGAEDE